MSREAIEQEQKDWEDAKKLHTKIIPARLISKYLADGWELDSQSTRAFEGEDKYVMRHSVRYSRFKDRLIEEKKREFENEILDFRAFKKEISEKLPSDSYVRRSFLLEPDFMPRHTLVDKMMLILDLHEKLRRRGVSLWEI